MTPLPIVSCGSVFSVNKIEMTYALMNFKLNSNGFSFFTHSGGHRSLGLNVPTSVPVSKPDLTKSLTLYVGLAQIEFDVENQMSSRLFYAEFGLRGRCRVELTQGSLSGGADSGVAVGWS
ncbi:hypothetical protein AVEN_47694-1 [Araneus ventricosus]|uniref:Uncharacterized protein n=1 Tax=Araneus ventricosus TaxID=182803 RepID=A0A4Y2IML8_ARAVE|nr:hypothetical protein AVEN_47694-1 [Araneus ventricosus]